MPLRRTRLWFAAGLLVALLAVPVIAVAVGPPQAACDLSTGWTPHPKI